MDKISARNSIIHIVSKRVPIGQKSSKTPVSRQENQTETVKSDLTVDYVPSPAEIEGEG
jgi:hypothetical protein